MPLNLEYAADLLKQPYVEPRWAIDEWLVEGESGLIVGEPKAYKSTLALDMAVSLATGTPFLGQFETAAVTPVMYIQEENNKSIMMPQLYQLMERAGIGRQAITPVANGDGLDKIWVPNDDAVDPDLYLSIRAGWRANKEEMGEVVNFANERGMKYIFIDPLYKVNENSLSNPDDVAPTLGVLSMIENETDASVVLVHHANKGNASGGKRILGSQLIWAWGANNIYIEKKSRQGGQKYLYVQREFRGKPEPDDIEMRFEEDFQWDIQQVVLDSGGKSVGGRGSTGYGPFIMKYQSDPVFAGLTRREQATMFGVSEKTIHNWLAKSGVKS